MTRLVRAELDRLRSRRVAWLALLLVFLTLAAFQLLVRSELSPPTPAQAAENRAYYEEAVREWEENHVEWEAACREDLGDGASDCVTPRPNEADFGLRSVPFAEVAEVSLTVTIYLVGLATFLVAGSFVAAEFSAGSMANWLTFVPERWRVYLAKLVAVVAFALATAVVFLGAALGAAGLLAAAYDVPITGLRSLLGLAGRGVVVAVVMAVVGCALGFLTRHTAAVIGVLLGCLFLVFVRNIVLFEHAWAQRLAPWSPEANIAAIVKNGHKYAVPQQVVTAEGLNTNYLERTVTLTGGLVYWAVLLAVLVTASLLVFRRRDVS